jgi:hypothetical protein
VVPLLERLAAAAAAALLAWQLARPDPRIGDDDFQVFYGGAAAIAAGHSPYVGDFVSPPWFALALVPFTWLPLEAARGAWLAVNLGLLLAATLAGAHLAGLAWPPRRLLLAALLVGLWPPVELGLRLGQSSLLVWTLVLAALLAARGGQFALAGGLLAVGLVKPQLVFLYVAGVAIWAARHHRFERYAAAGTGVLVALALVVLLVAPDAYADLLAARPRTWNYWGSTVALPPLFAALFDSQALALLVYLPIAVVGSVAAVGAWGRGDGSDLAYVGALTAAATLLLTPYAYPYDAILLQLPILWLVGAVSRQQPRWRLLVPLAALGIAGLWLLERPADYTAWRLLGLLPPLGTLLALVVARRKLS